MFIYILAGANNIFSIRSAITKWMVLMKWETESKQRKCYIKQKVHIGNRRKKSTHRK